MFSDEHIIIRIKNINTNIILNLYNQNAFNENPHNVIKYKIIDIIEENMDLFLRRQKILKIKSKINDI